MDLLQSFSLFLGRPIYHSEVGDASPWVLVDTKTPVESVLAVVVHPRKHQWHVHSYKQERFRKVVAKWVSHYDLI